MKPDPLDHLRFETKFHDMKFPFYVYKHRGSVTYIDRYTIYCTIYIYMWFKNLAVERSAIAHVSTQRHHTDLIHIDLIRSYIERSESPTN